MFLRILGRRFQSTNAFTELQEQRLCDIVRRSEESDAARLRKAVEQTEWFQSTAITEERVREIIKVNLEHVPTGSIALRERYEIKKFVRSEDDQLREVIRRSGRRRPTWMGVICLNALTVGVFVIFADGFDGLLNKRSERI
jgi:hypothetical protein